MPPKRKLSRAEAKILASELKEMSFLAKTFLKLLGQKVEQKKKKLYTIRVMVGEVGKPLGSTNTISIRTVDIHNTQVSKKGRSTFSQKMTWEEDIRRQRRGQIL